jgi:hypothetical protein
LIYTTTLALPLLYSKEETLNTHLDVRRQCWCGAMARRMPFSGDEPRPCSS